MKTKRIGLKKAMPSFIAILIGLVVGVAIIFSPTPQLPEKPFQTSLWDPS